MSRLLATDEPNRIADRHGATAVNPDDGFWATLDPLLDSGIRVVPVKPNARQPVWKHWDFGKLRKNGGYGSSATTHRERLRKHTEGAVRPGVAVPTGQPVAGYYLAVLDIDAENGGFESYSELVARIGEVPATATVLTKTEGCFHRWFASARHWLEAPKELGPGLELKRAGQFVMAPPTHGYTWALTPWGEGDPEWLDFQGGIWHWPALDAYLGMVVSAPAAAIPEPALVVPRVSERTSVDACLCAIAGAEPGQRTETLLRLGGKIAYATAIGHGLQSPEAVRAALWDACCTNGLTEDYSSPELARKIEVYVEWCAPKGNPFLQDDARSRKASEAHLVIDGWNGRGAETERILLKDLARHAKWELRPYSIRFGMLRTGLTYDKVRGGLKRLLAKGLVEQGTSMFNAPEKGEKTRATHTYRLTARGLTLGWEEETRPAS